MRKSSRLITQFYDERFSPLGLKVGQFSILRVVDICKVTTNKELQHHLVIDQTTLSRNLKPLIRDGLLSLSIDPNDQRVKNICLSAEGRKLYQQALPLWHEAQQELCKKLGEDDAEKILSLSDAFVKALSTS